jgi:hypothetical protein
MRAAFCVGGPTTGDARVARERPQRSRRDLTDSEMDIDDLDAARNIGLFVAVNEEHLRVLDELLVRLNADMAHARTAV